MTLLVKASPSGRVVVDVTPATAGWTHVGFKALRLGAGDAESLATGARELCITVLSGQVDVHVGAHVYRALGSRASVFEEASPTAVYVARGSRSSPSASALYHTTGQPERRASCVAMAWTICC